MPTFFFCFTELFKNYSPKHSRKLLANSVSLPFEFVPTGFKNPFVFRLQSTGQDNSETLSQADSSKSTAISNRKNVLTDRYIYYWPRDPSITGFHYWVREKIQIPDFLEVLKFRNTSDLGIRDLALIFSTARCELSKHIDVFTKNSSDTCEYGSSLSREEPHRWFVNCFLGTPLCFALLNLFHNGELIES